ncbi:MAG TPA: macro domain-containing protein [Gaiellaceae bacterium]|nr:macro domain-containing protein [Gaiellaceae bacterium]
MRGRIEVVRGDLTKQTDVDAIVNAANPELKPGGGVCGAIHEAAGPALAAECAAIMRGEQAYGHPPELVRGDTRITAGYGLPCSAVIHAVGPVWEQQDEEASDELLDRTYSNVITHARWIEAARVAAPAISCGIYGYPLARAAEVAMAAVERHDLELFRFVAMQDDVYEAFWSALPLRQKLRPANLVEYGGLLLGGREG